VRMDMRRDGISKVQQPIGWGNHPENPS
jgi:hypothetical protein